MALDFDKYAITSIDSITGFNIATKECLFILDEIKDATLTGAADTVWATGKEGRRLSALKRNKTCTITANNGFIVGGLLAMTIGDYDPVEEDVTPSISIPAFERIEVGAGGVDVVTAFEAIGTAGNEIGFIYKAKRDGSQGQKYAQSAAADADTFSYDPATKTITLPVGVFDEGDVIIVFYNYLTMGRKYTNRSSSYAGDVYLVCDVIVKDVCDGSLMHSMLVMPKVTISDNFSFTFGTDMAVQAFSAEANSSICAGESEYFYWVFPEAE